MTKNKDIIISSRIRFARNIKDYPFADRMDKTSAEEIIEKVEKALGEEYTVTDFSKLDRNERLSYVERHLVSPEFAENEMPCVLLSKGDLHVMVNEEDHIRVQAIKDGFDLEGAYSEAVSADDILLEKLNIAYDKKLGFLTHCPTNLGTGMRASCMVFLPCLTITKELNRIIPQLSKLGLTIRGMYGEGSEAGGYIYQISNTQTLGCDEAAAIKKLSEVINQIIAYEREAGERLKKEVGAGLTDRVMRSLGTLNYAYKLSSAEFMKLYANVRLGINLGIIDTVSLDTLDSLCVMPASLTLITGRDMTDEERDIERAAYVKKSLN